MAAYKNLKDRINIYFEKLPKNQKKIAEFYLENFDNVSFLNVQQAADATGTNVAAIVRFSQKLGYKGYAEMRNQIATSFQKKLNSKKSSPLIDQSKLKDDSLSSAANLEISNINETLNLNERENFDKAINLILSSERVFTVGLGISHLLVKIISYQLNQVGKFSNAFNNSSSTFMEQILLLNKNDLVIALSFPPYSKATIDAVKFAKEKRIKVIAITNKKSSPISMHADVSFIVKSENMLFTNSFAAISVLINAIVTEVAIRDEVRALKILKEIKKITEIQNSTID